MLLKIKYPLLIKYWSKYFLDTLGLISVYSFIQIFMHKISLYLAIYNFKNCFSTLISNRSTKNLSLIDFKIISLKLKHNMQILFQVKFIVYIFDIFSLVSLDEHTENNLLGQSLFGLKIKAYKNLLDIVFLSIKFKIPYLLINYLSKLFFLIKNQRSFVDLLKQILNNFYTNILGELKGFKLIISGKINGSSRTNLITLSSGKVGLIKVGSSTCYAYMPSSTYTGVFGFKLWLTYK